MAEILQDARRSLFRRKSTHRVGPSRWAQARLQFISGELATYDAVSQFLGVEPGTVQNRASQESWTKQRQAHAEAVQKQVERLGRGEGLELKEADLLSLTSSRADLARLALRFGQTLSTELDRLSVRIEAEADPEKLLTLSKARALALDSLCRLAGLPEPNAKPAQSKPAPSPAQTQGRAPVSAQSMSAEPVDGPSDDPAAGE